MTKLINNFVKVCDVTLRDGIQNLKSSNNNPIFSTSIKNNIINKLVNANIKNIEFGSNVSHKITEMINTKQVLESIEYNKLHNLNLFLLVPNYNKFQELDKWNNINYVNRISLITACSNTFIQKNTNMTFNENLDQIDKTLTLPSHGKKFRIYISTCFGCPFEGSINKLHINNINKIFNRFSTNDKVDEIVISDTIGNYDMMQLNQYIQAFKLTKKLSLHIHSDSEDPNIQKIIEKYGDQLISMDTSLGNLGGCPSVVSSKLKPNLSTLKVAQIINNSMGTTIYNTDALLDLEILVKNILNKTY